MQSPEAAPCTIVVVDPDPAAETLVDALTRDGFRARRVATGTEAEHLTGSQDELQPAVVLLEIVLPDTDGLILCERLAQAGLRVIVHSATRRRLDAIRALRLGAQDFVPKSAGPDELRARLRRLLPSPGGHEHVHPVTPRDQVPSIPARLAQARPSTRRRDRVNPLAILPPSTVLPELAFSDLRHQVLVGGKAARLSTGDYNLLRLLATCGDRPVTREDIAAHLWPDADPADPRLTDAVPGCIYHLRVRLRCAGLPLSIRTLRGLGYTLTQPIGQAAG